MLNRIANTFVIVASLLAALALGPIAYNRILRCIYPLPHDYVVGQVAKFPGLVPGKPALVLAVTPACGICRQDAKNGVYERLGTALKIANPGIKVVTMIPAVSKTVADEFLHRYRIPGELVLISSPAKYPFNGTPNILLVDERQKIVGVWKGGMSGAREAEIIKLLPIVRVSANYGSLEPAA